MAGVAGVSPAFQALSLETSNRRLSKLVSGNVVSMLSTSFVGDVSQLAMSSSSAFQSPASRSFNALCVRMDSRLFSKDPSTDFDDISSAWNVDNRSYQSFSQRSAVATTDYALPDLVDFRQERNVFPNEQVGAGFATEVDSEGNGTANRGLDIAQLGLKEELVSVLARRGITHLFPIQEAVLKPALAGSDIIGRARTGTGKTLAFGIPIIQRLLEQNEENMSFRRLRYPRALVLAPTRELAVQVEKEFMESAPNLSTLCVYGGVSITAQQRKLQKGVDIAVGTPGRVIDLLEKGSLVLSDVKYLILDEADQMLAVGFEEDVETILEQLPAQRQSMLFSATMPGWVSKLSRKYLKSPLTIDLVGDSDEKLAEGIKIYSISTPPSAKRSVLSDLITVYGKGGKTIVFTQTKKDADEVALSMNRMLGTEALHGDISQAQREKTLNAFRNGNFSVLVATDVAARGLDIPNVDLVIHFEIPNDPETFVHRSGRTGRAGKEGLTILMHSDTQRRTVRNIERDVGCKFEPITAPTADDVLKASCNQARDALNKVHPDLKAVFRSTAEMLFREQGVDALAAAVAHLSGFTQPPASRSLITYEQGWMTLKVTRNQRWGGGGFISTRNVMGFLGSIYPKAADEMGKILMLDEQEGSGAVFDLPEDIAKELLGIELQPGDSIEAIKKLPRLQYDEAPRDRYGRFSSRGGGSRMGRSDMSSRGSDRFSGSRDSTWRRQDDRSGSWGDNSYASRRQDRSDGWGGSQGDSYGRPFNQNCFICGQPGHRAAVCPNRR